MMDAMKVSLSKDFLDLVDFFFQMKYKAWKYDIYRQLRAKKRRGGLVGYDAALTQLRSGVRFPSTVLFVLFDCDSK